jgi:hypothetical protein
VNDIVAATVGTIAGTKKIVRYIVLPRFGFVRIQAVNNAKAIRKGIEIAEIQIVFFTEVQNKES